MTRPADLTWNLENDKTTISDPSLFFFEDGDCSDRSDPSSDCCRITCEECYVLISVASKIGVKATVAVFVELEAGIEFPESYSGLATKYLDSTSFFHIGDCSQPHFMELNGFAGYKDVYLTLPMSLDLVLISKSAEPVLYSETTARRQSLFSGCIAAVYDAQVVLSTAIDTISALSEDKQEQLKKIIMWALGLSEIDPNFLTINSNSDTTGEISIQIAVPPAVAEKYPTSYDLESTFYERARTASFSSAVSAFVVSVWMATGDQHAANTAIFQPIARASDAIKTVVTPLSARRVTIRTGDYVTCEKAYGSVLTCTHCEDGYWGSTCESSCTTPANCASARCNLNSGDEIECTECISGFWGSTCTSSCEVPQHCVSAECSQDNAVDFGANCDACNRHREHWNRDKYRVLDEASVVVDSARSRYLRAIQDALTFSRTFIFYT
ncbi:hypothetical protein PHYSODRAFT_326278 [Phytophthora sojae]|uniref:Uncharacterized protein n=1 Tax=Phytophthora sojae (strain P6497) TaxID=1094619 RepID=G4Z0E0_PHYSP|nr:hypothetical protein PHYSODRAFT_326278 [Phytophthora sojae]EGZ25226.1 hypothetical protein PHYSODRAFT_326278 [Phytophthora sojae]|eukprot:XP_009520514.1 hypothetical protein PHYSODRAFT_326278 [Phytophthora sojae]